MTKLQVFPHHHRKTFTRSHFQNTLEDLNIPQIKIDASRKPKVVFYSLCQQLRSITDFRESLFSQCLAVRARQANEMLAKGYKQSSRFGRWDPVEVFVILFPFSVAVQCIACMYGIYSECTVCMYSLYSISNSHTAILGQSIAPGFRLKIS